MIEGLEHIEYDVRRDLQFKLQKSGLYYRIFGRVKSEESITKKLEAKKSKYIQGHMKMQDLIGIRIIFYFLEDVDIIDKYLRQIPEWVDVSDSSADIKSIEPLLGDQIKHLSDKIFMPVRLNHILRLSDINTSYLNNVINKMPEYSQFIDNTYELQLRTVLSEGWHELEHDLRYKTINENWWVKCETESRMLNGIYATLESSERSLEYIFDKIAYSNYKSHEWSAMIRNHLKIRTRDTELSPDIINILNVNEDLAKSLFRVPRRLVIEKLLEYNRIYPLTINNLVFLLNRLDKNNNQLHQQEGVISDALNRMFQ